MKGIVIFSTLVIIFFSYCGEKPNTILKSANVTFTYNELKGLESEVNITRRDPSDIIMWKGKYYIWYTKTDKGHSGYNATIWYAESGDGFSWKEIGEALTRGELGSWDEYSVFTPNILMADDKYYLFYTAVRRTLNRDDFYFENNSKNDFTAIGIAVANSPNDPFVRIKNNPVLSVSQDSSSFDSYRVDDACVIFRDEKYWLYFKGRSILFGSSGPANTKMGVAISSQPEGPFTKYGGNPVTNSGHEVMVWPYESGVMTLISAVGENGKTIQYAKDGLNFEIITKIGDDYPMAPGYFRADNFIANNHIEINNFWGISMKHGNNKMRPYLVRYDFLIKND